SIDSVELSLVPSTTHADDDATISASDARTIRRILPKAARALARLFREEACDQSSSLDMIAGRIDIGAWSTSGGSVDKRSEGTGSPSFVIVPSGKMVRMANDDESRAVAAGSR